MNTAAQKFDRMLTQVTVSHRFLEHLGLTHDQFARTVLDALKNARHPETGQPIELPKGSSVTVSDDRIPLTLY